MKKITFTIIILGLGYYFTQSFLRSSPVKDEDQLKTDTTKVSKESKTPAPPSPPVSSTTKSKDSNHDAHDHGDSDEGFEVKEVEVPNDKDGASLMELSDIASIFASKDVNIEALKDSLTKSGLEVVSTKDSNPYTGSMTVIRTNNSLPGTRYFHAQVFSSEDGNPYIQHMSYEYRPSENAFAEAVAATKKSFGLKKVADVRKDGFYSWSTDDGYIIWIKRMEKEDLKDDPFNAYTDADIGTIRVAKELEIH